MTAETNLGLGMLFAAVGIAAAILQGWLWMFPMEPDPTGNDPNGRTTAPLLWRRVHRALGYTFAALYIVLVARMIPRFPFLGETADTGIIVHVILGIAIAPILLTKIFILRFAKRFGKALPMMGGLLAAIGILIVAMMTNKGGKLASLPTNGPDEIRAKRILLTRCMNCHGASPMLARDADDSWSNILEKMQEIAKKSNRPDPVQGDAAILIAYLERIEPRLRQAKIDLGEGFRREREEVEGENDRGRGRGSKND